MNWWDPLHQVGIPCTMSSRKFTDWCILIEDTSSRVRERCTDPCHQLLRRVEWIRHLSGFVLLFPIFGPETSNSFASEGTWRVRPYIWSIAGISVRRFSKQLSGTNVLALRPCHGCKGPAFELTSDPVIETLNISRPKPLCCSCSHQVSCEDRHEPFSLVFMPGASGSSHEKYVSLLRRPPALRRSWIELVQSMINTGKIWEGGYKGYHPVILYQFIVLMIFGGISTAGATRID